MNKKEQLTESTRVAAQATTLLLNGRTKMAVMLGIGMVLALNGCQKEAEEDWLPLNGTSQETQSLLHICYHLDDEVYHVTIEGDAAMSNLMRYLCDQASQGHRVLVYDEDKVSAIATKESITYETTSKDDLFSWGAKMLEKGYKVEYATDEKSGKYIGTARK